MRKPGNNELRQNSVLSIIARLNEPAGVVRAGQTPNQQPL